MPTFETLEEWARSQIQSLMQSVLDEEVTHALGRLRYERQAQRVKWRCAWGVASRIAWTGPGRSAMTSPMGTNPC